MYISVCEHNNNLEALNLHMYEPTKMSYHSSDSHLFDDKNAKNHSYCFLVLFQENIEEVFLSPRKQVLIYCLDSNYEKILYKIPFD